MSKTLNCRDLGVDCDYVANGETEDEILAIAAEHAKMAHGFDEIPPELVEKARSAVREVQAAG